MIDATLKDKLRKLDLMELVPYIEAIEDNLKNRK